MDGMMGRGTSLLTVDELMSGHVLDQSVGFGCPQYSCASRPAMQLPAWLPAETYPAHAKPTKWKRDHIHPSSLSPPSPLPYPATTQLRHTPGTAPNETPDSATREKKQQKPDREWAPLGLRLVARQPGRLYTHKRAKWKLERERTAVFR